MHGIMHYAKQYREMCDTCGLLYEDQIKPPCVQLYAPVILGRVLLLNEKEGNHIAC